MDRRAPTTPRKFLNTLTLLHTALTAGPLIIGLIFYYNTPIQEYQELEGDIFIYVFPFIGLMGVLASTYMFKILIKNLENKPGLHEKLAGFLSASLIRFALLEGPAILNLVWFSNTGNLLFLTVAGVLVLLLFLQRPTKLKVDRELHLKGEHKRQFDRMDDPIPMS